VNFIGNEDDVVNRVWRVRSGLAVVLAAGEAVAGQDRGGAAPTTAELAAISERGRALAAYDQAAWHATDAVQMANPKTAQGQHYLARVEGGRWTVVFGELNAEKSAFLIDYEAVAMPGKPGQFEVQRDDPPREDGGFYLFAARALQNALADFGRTARPYNAAVLPAAEGRLHVYLYPAQAKANVYPLGGDVRYLVTPDGENILEKRQLHKSIVETGPMKGKKFVAGLHTDTLSDVPEDTDVLHVLQQNPPVPEIVGTAHYVYEIGVDGAIRVKQARKK
jgi:hypothetical protein